MPFPEGTSVTFLTDSGDSNIGTVKGFEDGKYLVEVEDGKIIEIEEAKVNEFKIQMSRRDIFDTLK